MPSIVLIFTRYYFFSLLLVTIIPSLVVFYLNTLEGEPPPTPLCLRKGRRQSRRRRAPAMAECCQRQRTRKRGRLPAFTSYTNFTDQPDHCGPRSGKHTGSLGQAWLPLRQAKVSLGKTLWETGHKKPHPISRRLRHDFTESPRTQSGLPRADSLSNGENVAGTCTEHVAHHREEPLKCIP